jgi:hypothetical protein
MERCLALLRLRLRRSRYISFTRVKLLEIIGNARLSRRHHPDARAGERSFVETIARFVT